MPGAGMNFELTDDQELIRRSVAELARKFDDRYWMEKDQAHEFPTEFYRAIADGEEEGFVKVHVKRGTDRIVGATIVARHAGEMLAELTTAITAGVGLGAIAGVIHTYPTQAEGIKRVADVYNRTRLTPGVKQWLTRWLAWTR